MKKFFVLLFITIVVVNSSTVNASLIGVQIGDRYPDIVFDNKGTITYTAANDQFTLLANDLRIVYSDNTEDALYGVGVLVDMIINLNVGSDGKIVGTGTMQEIVRQGEVAVKGHTYGAGTTLLTGSVYDFGWDKAFTYGFFDFLINNVSGSLVSDGIWSNNVPTGAVTMAENLNGWGGSWDTDFNLSKVKGDKAPIPEPATMALLGLGAFVLRKRKV